MIKIFMIFGMVYDVLAVDLITTFKRKSLKEFKTVKLVIVNILSSFIFIIYGVLIGNLSFFPLLISNLCVRPITKLL